MTAELAPRKIGIDSMHGEKGTEPLMDLMNAKLNVNFISIRGLIRGFTRLSEKKYVTAATH